MLIYTHTSNVYNYSVYRDSIDKTSTMPFSLLMCGIQMQCFTSFTPTPSGRCTGVPPRLKWNKNTLHKKNEFTQIWTHHLLKCPAGMTYAHAIVTAELYTWRDQVSLYLTKRHALHRVFIENNGNHDCTAGRHYIFVPTARVLSPVIL